MVFHDTSFEGRPLVKKAVLFWMSEQAWVARPVDRGAKGDLGGVAPGVSRQESRVSIAEGSVLAAVGVCRLAVSQGNRDWWYERESRVWEDLKDFEIGASLHAELRRGSNQTPTRNLLQYSFDFARVEVFGIEAHYEEARVEAPGEVKYEGIQDDRAKKTVSDSPHSTPWPTCASYSMVGDLLHLKSQTWFDVSRRKEAEAGFPWNLPFFGCGALPKSLGSEVHGA